MCECGFARLEDGPDLGVGHGVGDALLVGLVGLVRLVDEGNDPLDAVLDLRIGDGSVDRSASTLSRWPGRVGPEEALEKPTRPLARSQRWWGGVCRGGEQEECPPRRCRERSRDPSRRSGGPCGTP